MASSFLFGTPEQFGRSSMLGDEQMGLYSQLRSAASGAAPMAGQYYQGLMSENPAAFQAFAAPAQRDFRQNILPQIGARFAGMGAGAQGSSGYRNAMMQAGTDLAERLAAMRAGLQQQGAQGLMNLSQQGLGQYSQPFYRPRAPGFLETMGGGLSQGLGQGLGVPFGSFLQRSLMPQQAFPGTGAQQQGTLPR